MWIDVSLCNNAAFKQHFNTTPPQLEQAPTFHCDSRGSRPDTIGTTMVKKPPIAALSVNCTQFQRVFHVILWRMHYLLLSLFKI